MKFETKSEIRKQADTLQMHLMAANAEIERYRRAVGEFPCDVVYHTGLLRSYDTRPPKGHTEVLNRATKAEGELDQARAEIERLNASISSLQRRSDTHGAENTELRDRIEDLMKDVPFKIGQQVRYLKSIAVIQSIKGNIATVFVIKLGETQTFQVDVSLLSHIV